VVKTIKEGDLCLVFCNGEWDDLGYPTKIYGYDAAGTVGLLAKRIKLNEKQLIRIPEHTRYSLPQWAAFSLRYITAWSNWKVAYGTWRLQLTKKDCDRPYVWGWGGGVTLAEVTLAKYVGCKVAMISSDDERLKLMNELGIVPIDRRKFCNLKFDPERYGSDPPYKKSYQAAEKVFLDIVDENTHSAGVSIFIDFIGLPVFRATLKALARPGVITTAGWKAGMRLSTIRAVECMSWHTHVHTHYARYCEAVEAVRFAEENAWMPGTKGDVYGWDDVPQLAQDYDGGRISTYYPIFQVNRL
jgi:NADPH:quinone reductase-like Zn-dependent oxidoreductase